MNTLIINVIKLYAKPLCTNINIAEITLMNTSLITDWAIKMTKITDFQFNMQIICFTLNITGKSYAKKIHGSSR